MGVVALFLLNAVRLTALILIGDAGAPRIALGGFHSQAGWISFNIVALGLAVAARRVAWISRVASITTAPISNASISQVSNFNVPARSVLAVPAGGIEDAPYENPAATYLVPFPEHSFWWAC